jgi:adenylate cyclase
VLDKPSIAVLPFDNMSGDPAQDYFCDGVVEDIITALSHLPWLFVIARTSTFTYKGRAVDVKQIGKELGVRYIVQGGIRRSGDKLRITAQLTDVANASNLWAERYDRQVTDVFDLQDEITASVAGALEPSLRLAEIERAKQKRPENLRAYDLYLRSLPPFYSMTREGSDEAIRLLRDAIALEPDYAIAWSALAYCLAWRVSHGWSTMGEVGEEALHTPAALSAWTKTTQMHLPLQRGSLFTFTNAMTKPWPSQRELLRAIQALRSPILRRRGCTFMPRNR